MLVFNLKTDYIELHQLLKVTGLTATGGEAKQAIAGGYVKVNGAVETRKANKIRAGFKVEFEGNVIEVREGPEEGVPPMICR